LDFQLKNLTRIIISSVAGFAVCALFIILGWLPVSFQHAGSAQSKPNAHQAQEASEPSPLYWVAPMDPNFRRDEPGLSPMGMDLVPFYASANDSSEKGVVLLTPEVTNNISVGIEHVQFKPWQSHIESFGTFEYDEERIHHLHSRVSGWIDKLYVNAQGEKVSKGQPLYSFYSPELANAQEELMLSIKTKEPQLIYAARAKLAALGVPLQTIADIVKAGKVQKNITYYAEHDGVVKKLMVRHGFYVKPESNIMSIAPLDSIWLMAEVFESQLRFIQLNASVVISTDAYPGTKIMGTVDYIYPSLKMPSRTAKVRIRVNNKTLKLKPNMFAEVTFTQTDKHNSVIVPLTTVIRTGKSDRVVLVKDSGSYQSIAVSLGRSDNKFVEITSGLKEGDCIVSSAQFLIDSESSIGREFSRMNAQTMKETPVIYNTDSIQSKAIQVTPSSHSSHHGH